MKLGVVILSRFSSSRLPGKALMKIKGKEILKYIVERVEQVIDRENIVIATSNLDSDNPIAKFASENGINCFRGSLENVSERFYLAGIEKGWDYAIRINGDNIFLDSNILKSMVSIVNKNNYDFVSNVKDRTFPKGMSIEIVKLAYYSKLLDQITASEKYREHVTLFLYEHDVNENFLYIYNNELKDISGMQLALDTQDDFERTKKIMNYFDLNHWEYNLKEIDNILKIMGNE